MKKIIAYTALILLLGSPIYFGGWVLYNTIPYHIEAYDWFLASIMLLTFVIFFKVGERIGEWALDTIHKKRGKQMSDETLKKQKYKKLRFLLNKASEMLDKLYTAHLKDRQKKEASE